MNQLIPSELESGLEHGRKTSTLAFALLTLPAKRRRDMEDYYRFCRLIDDIADSGLIPLERKALFLGNWSTALSTGAGLPEFLARIIEKYDLDVRLLGEVVAGVQSDLGPVRFEDFEDLRKYCWQVGSAVGLGCLPIFGADPVAAGPYAENLGIALQLTNIIRDVGEDARADRVYLPQSEIRSCELDPADLTASEGKPGFLRLMRLQAERARFHFLAAENALPEADRSSLRAPRIMGRFYQTLLGRIEAGKFRVISRRHRLSFLEKVAIAVPIAFGR